MVDISTMKEHAINKTNDFIRGYYIDPEICDRIVSESKIHNFRSGVMQYTDAKLEDFSKETCDAYAKALFGVIEEYKKEFRWSYERVVMWGLPHGIKVQHYAPGKWYDEWHCERAGDVPTLMRHLVYMTYLNDVEDGGGTEFYHQKIATKAEKGLTLIWPVDWTHMHRGIVAPTEEKMIITGWWMFKGPEDEIK
jgi:hypothetical protein